MTPVQFITNQTPRYSHEEGARLALHGGCRWVQLRIKEGTDDEVEPVARRLLKACREQGATFVIDDRVELVKRIEADGVHLGKKDMPVSEARAFLGEGFLIGGTANTIDDIRQLHRASADYIGLGPFRFTTTKKGLSPILGLEGLKAIMTTVVAEEINVSICAIGGITLADVPAIMATGVDGIAVSGEVLRAVNPSEAMRQLINE